MRVNESYVLSMPGPGVSQKGENDLLKEQLIHPRWIQMGSVQAEDVFEIEEHLLDGHTGKISQHGGPAHLVLQWIRISGLRGCRYELPDHDIHGIPCHCLLPPPPPKYPGFDFTTDNQNS